MSGVPAIPGPPTHRHSGESVSRSRFLRPKGHIGPRALFALMIAGTIPLVMALSRVLAFPGILPAGIPGGEMLYDLGRALNESVSLAWVPASDRPAILYLLLLPTGALLVALARLTFGIRVLGLRAILIAIGFQEAGVLPSLVLMAIVVALIVAIRPSLKHIRLPLYARLTVILSLAAMIMVGALVLGPMLRSESIWSVAFFPVIIVAMLAEGVAKTLANDNAVTAIWRTFWTILLAGVIALVGQSTAYASLTLHFPEVLLTQLVLIVFVAEFLDFRLLEAWPRRLTRLVEGVRPWYTDKFPVAVVRNRWNTGVIGRLGRAAPRRYRKRSVQRVVDALRDLGFDVRVFEADMSLLRELKDFLPPDPRTDLPGGIVFNFATGTQGRGRFCQAPAMLELGGVAYTGPDPVAQANLADRLVLLSMLERAGVDVPRFAPAACADDAAVLDTPLMLRPRYEPDESGTLVTERGRLAEKLERMRRRFQQDLVAEERAPGRDFRVALLGNEVVECLPIVEQLAEGSKICPAPVDDALAERLRDCACRAYRAAGCRDFARIDLRRTTSGEVLVVGVRCTHLFARRGAFVRAAEAGGYDFTRLMMRIMEEAARRYDGSAGSSAERGVSGDTPVVSLAARRVAAR